MRARRLRVLFRTAAGARIGFGHLVRCRSIARALSTEALVSVRGTRRTQHIARSHGWSLVDPFADRDLRHSAFDVIVIDEPSAVHAGIWLRRARRLGIPVASVHDLGLGHIESDVRFDASADPILDPSVLDARLRARRPVPLRVLVALGGAGHVRALAARLTDAIAARVPNVSVHVACGFLTDAGRPALAHGRWVPAPDGLTGELSAASIVVTAGGVTLLEACALGVPAVALAVTEAQRATVRAVTLAGAAVDAGWPPGNARIIANAADAVAALLPDARACGRMSDAGRRLVDGLGAFRAADRLRDLGRACAA
jgi:spore coat polysaccharide biosynthesis predicted glycosyltransferase SpsG